MLQIKYQGKIQDPKDLVTKEYTDTKEALANKSTTISNDDTKYPTLSAVFNYIASNNGFSRPMGWVNANNIRSNGFYYITNASNTPAGVTSNGYLFVQVHSSNTGYVVQHYLPHDSDNLYYRRCNVNSWQPWVKLAHDTEVAHILSSFTEGNILIANSSGDIKDSGIALSVVNGEICMSFEEE